MLREPRLLVPGLRPNGPVKLVAGHQALKHFDSVVLPTHSACVDLTGNYQYEYLETGTPVRNTTSADPWGIGHDVQCSSAITDNANWRTTTNVVTSGASSVEMLLVFTPRVVDGNKVLGGVTSTLTYNQPGLWVWADNSPYYRTSEGLADFVSINSVGARQETDKDTCVAGRQTVLAISCANASVTSVINGKFTRIGWESGTGTLGTVQLRYRIGSIAASLTGFDGIIHMAAFGVDMPRQSLEFMRSITADPYQMFEPA